MKKSILFFLSLVTLMACNKEPIPSVISPPVDDLAEDWSIPLAEVKDGGVGKDGIPAIESPYIIAGSAATFLNDDELVLGIKYNNTVIAYPHKILNYHEIVNHEIDDFPFSISYCPLTGTGILYNGIIENEVTSFGVSGLLFNSNLILYDRASDSYWPQMMLKSASGVHRDKKNEFYQLVETTWGTWKKWYPDSKVLSFQTSMGVLANYDHYPYGDYRTNDDYLLYSVPTTLKTIPQKERLLGIRIDDQVIYARFNSFSGTNEGYIIRELNDEKLLIFGSKSENYMFAFKEVSSSGNVIKVNKMLLGIEPGGLFEDTEGNKWDVFGHAYEGEAKGDSLLSVENYIGYAFAWGAFYPDAFVSE